MKTRWLKILKDIWSNKSRSILVVFSIAIGVAAVGMINNAGIIIQRDLYGTFADGNPALLEIYISPFDESLARAVEGMREVEYAQAHRVLNASFYRQNGKREDIALNILPDYDDVRVSKFMSETGAAEPKIREILLERQSAQALGLSLGDTFTIEMANERHYDLTVSGIVHDVYVMPYSLMGEVTGYINMETLQWMGETPYYNRLDLTTSERQSDKQHVIEVGNLVRDRTIEPAGLQVIRIQIPGNGANPGEHWGQNPIQGFLLILQIMGVLAMFLSSGLVINTVSAILNQQIRQIGIMRSVGAVRRQVVGMYLVNVLVLSTLGLLIAIPLGLLGAWWLVEFAAGFLNFDVSGINLPPSVLAWQIALGLLMPVGVALIPILAGSRISVYDAIYQHGLGGEEGNGRFENWLTRFRRLSPPVMLSLRNTFRKKGRLTFTLITLTLAGAMFIAVFSTRASLSSQISQIKSYLVYDASLRLSPGAQKRAVIREALRIPGVEVAETWLNATGVILHTDGSESKELEVIGLPHNPLTIDPILLAGNWIDASGANQIVVNDDLLDEEPGISVGDQIVLEVGDKKQTYVVNGILSKHLSGPRIYMDEDTFAKLTGRTNQADVVRVLATPGSLASNVEQDRIANQLETRLDNAGLSTSKSQTQHAFFGDFTDVFDIILIVLIIMAGILAIVGGLGLTGTMGMNILERTREIGVLRAVGASNFAVRQVVLVEGVVVGFISWLMAAMLSGPSALALAAAVISTVLKADLSFKYSFPGLFIWLMVVLLIGMFSSLAPARNAVRLRVREVLDYE